jgi:hypothetical protein
LKFRARRALQRKNSRRDSTELASKSSRDRSFRRLRLDLGPALGAAVGRCAEIVAAHATVTEKEVPAVRMQLAAFPRQHHCRQQAEQQRAPQRLYENHLLVVFDSVLIQQKLK